MNEDSVAFIAYNQAVEDAQAAIRAATANADGSEFFSATFINAIARRCSPHVYVNRLAAAATAAPQHERLFEAKLLGFGEGDRIRLCEPCLKRAIDEHLVSFSSALPAAPVAKSNREPHAFQEHPLYPNYCAFAVGDEDYCKRETDNVIHQVATAAPVEQSDASQSCQRCGRIGGKIVNFNYDSITTSRWICPHCLDANEEAR